MKHEYYHYERVPYTEADAWRMMGKLLLYLAAITAVIIAAFYQPS